MRSPSPRLLAIDTSTRMVGLALYDGVQVLAESTWTSRDHHTVELAPAIADALKKCALSAADLGALAVATGPGSFTGLRIGMALAKGIALAQHIPIIGIPTLDILAAAQPVLALTLVAVLRAGRGRLATGWYQVTQDHWQPISQPKEQHTVTLTIQELAQRIQTPTLVVGELSTEERLDLVHNQKNAILTSPAFSVRRPSFLAELAWKRWQVGETDDPASLAPTYLHYNDPIPG